MQTAPHTNEAVRDLMREIDLVIARDIDRLPIPDVADGLTKSGMIITALTGTLGKALLICGFVDGPDERAIWRSLLLDAIDEATNRAHPGTLDQVADRLRAIAALRAARAKREH